jgi:hypothetical protein
MKKTLDTTILEKAVRRFKRTTPPEEWIKDKVKRRPGPYVLNVHGFKVRLSKQVYSPNNTGYALDILDKEGFPEEYFSSSTPEYREILEDAYLTVEKNIKTFMENQEKRKSRIKKIDLRILRRIL